MKELLFITELKQQINEKHKLALRNLYLPILGMEPIILYQLLIDYNEMNQGKKAYYEWKDIAKTSRMSIIELDIAKKKLEAVGLLRTFVSPDEIHHIFTINPPLLANEFKNNSLLYREAVKQIGDLLFERTYFATQEIRIAKDEFAESTAKYHDVFDANVQQQQNTLDMPKVNFENKDDAVKGLTSSQFINYITNNRVSPTQLSMIQRVQNAGLSSWSLNEIIDYTFVVEGKIVSNYIESIANDLINKNITDPKDIRLELHNAKENSERLSSSTTSKEEKVEDTVSTTDSDWNDIFNSLGGEL